jgi:hypothetical protein
MVAPDGVNALHPGLVIERVIVMKTLLISTYRAARFEEIARMVWYTVAPKATGNRLQAKVREA